MHPVHATKSVRRASRLGLAPILVGLPLLLLIGGCATSYAVKVDALAKPNAEPSISYQLRNRNPALADDSLRFQEAANQVRTALSGKGMFEAPPSVKPDLILDLDYGVSPPTIKKEMVAEPQYQSVPGRIVYDRVQVGVDQTGKPLYRTVAVQEPPTQEFAGYREYEVTMVVYEKYLKLAAHENKPDTEGKGQADAWNLTITTEGENRDIRKALPILAAASIEYVGKDTHGEKVVHLKDNNPDIAFVKKGMGDEVSRVDPPPPAKP